MKKIKEKQFDAVKMMHEIRSKISNETQNMTFGELKKIFKQNLKKVSLKLSGK